MGDQGGLPGKDDPSDEVISQRAFSRLVGVSSAAINKAIKNGRLSADCVCATAGGNQLYLEKALIEWEAIHPEFDPGSISGIDEDRTPPPNGWGAFKTQQEALLAERKRLDLERAAAEDEGKLFRADDIEAVWIDRISRTRALLLAIPTSAAPAIASLLKQKLKPTELTAAIQQNIESRIYACLTAISTSPEAIEEMSRQILEVRKNRKNRKKKRSTNA